MKSRLSQKKLHDNLFVASFLIYPIILFLVFYVYVNFNSILLAFKEYDFKGNYKWVSFDNFSSFIENIRGGSALWAQGLSNSFKMYFIALIICLPLYVLFSYIIFKKCFMHKQLRAISMIPQIVSGFIICLVFKKFVEGAIPDIVKSVFGKEEFPNLLQDTGYAFGTTLFYQIWISFATNLIVYPNAMTQIDDSILEAGKIDGVGNMFQELWYLIIPLIFPTISTFLITGLAAIFTNAGSLPTFYMYSAPTSAVNIGYIYWRDVANSSNYAGYPMLAAGGLLMTFFVAPLTILVRWLLEKFGPTTEGY
ncbi:MAG: sugar ABC transporter permease [Clostridia bacterium]|nr:sugar ABC transporter permease [Clostridia bacterium]